MKPTICVLFTTIIFFVVFATELPDYVDTMLPSYSVKPEFDSEVGKWIFRFGWFSSVLSGIF